MSANPTDRRYRKTHEWFQPQGDTVTIGITQFAADELTDITYVALPAVGTRVAVDKSFGEVESVKATSDLYSALDGEVVGVNPELSEHPELVNGDPFGKGWMLRVRPSNAAQLSALLDPAAYDAMTSGQA